MNVLNIRESVPNTRCTRRPLCDRERPLVNAVRSSRRARIMTRDLRIVVAGYVTELAGSRADEACHSLLELGPGALPHIEEAFSLARDTGVKIRLAEVVYGLVMVGDEPVGRTRALEVLAAAREDSDPEKLSWIDEAISQIRPATNEPA